MWGSLKHKFVLPFLGINEREDGTAFLIDPYMEKQLYSLEADFEAAQQGTLQGPPVQ